MIQEILGENGLTLNAGDLLVDTGYVGIGTSNPSAPLNIERGGSGDEMIRLHQTANDGSANPFISFYESATRRGFIQWSETSSEMRMASEYGGIAFMTGTGGGESDRVLITSSGNVGIGTSSPSTLLDVNGDITVSGTVDGVDVAGLDTTVSNHTSNTSNPHSTSFSNLGGSPSDAITAGTDLSWSGSTLNYTGTGGGIDAEDNGTAVVTGATAVNFNSNLSVTDDGDGTVTVDAEGGGSLNTISKSSSFSPSDSESGSVYLCSGTITVTLPDGLSNGWNGVFINTGTGTISFSATTTLHAPENLTDLSIQYGQASAIHSGSNVWYLEGNLE